MRICAASWGLIELQSSSLSSSSHADRLLLVLREDLLVLREEVRVLARSFEWKGFVEEEVRVLPRWVESKGFVDEAS